MICWWTNQRPSTQAQANSRSRCGNLRSVTVVLSRPLFAVVVCRSVTIPCAVSQAKRVSTTMWWKNCKMKAIIALLVVVSVFVLGVAVGVGEADRQ